MRTLVLKEIVEHLIDEKIRMKLTYDHSLSFVHMALIADIYVCLLIISRERILTEMQGIIGSWGCLLINRAFC